MPPGWDFAVVGAGPAGARAAELLANRGASVVLMDPRAPWEKPCGGGLTAAALRHAPELRELGGESQTIREVLCVAPSICRRGGRSIERSDAASLSGAGCIAPEWPTG